MKNIFALFVALCFAIPIVALAGITNPPEIISNVSPVMGPLYLTNHALPDLDYYSYHYAFDLSKIDTETKKRAETDLVLIIFDSTDPSSQKNWINESKNGKLVNSELRFDVNFTEIFNGTEFLGKLGYRLIDKKYNRILTDASGPEIIFNFRNERPQNQERGYTYSAEGYTYSVEARSSINSSNVWILYKDIDGKWYKYWEYREYLSTDKEWKLLEWKIPRYYQELEFVIDMAASKKTPFSLYIEQNYSDQNTANVSMRSYNATSYDITIKNSCDNKIYDIIVRNTLAPNIEYMNSSYLYPEGEVLDEPNRTNLRGNWTLAWTIGDLAPSKRKVIRLFTKNYNTLPSVAENNRVNASGFTLGNVVGFYESMNATIAPGPQD